MRLITLHASESAKQCAVFVPFHSCVFLFVCLSVSLYVCTITENNNKKLM